MPGKKKEIYTPRRSPAILFALVADSLPARANFAPFFPRDTLGMQINRE